MAIPIKRVVTGVDEKGASIPYEDATLHPVELDIMPGVQIFPVWSTEGPLVSPAADPAPASKSFFPGPGGTRFGLFRLPPDSAVPADHAQPDEATVAAQVAAAEEAVPGLLAAFEPDAPGMHQTVTVDYVIVIEGDLWLELDDGVEVPLPAGTCVVQNGARHGWRNHGSTPGTLAYVILDGGNPE
ncbi:cupin domain-containing protein [Amycolatopsis ultiminotia]